MWENDKVILHGLGLFPFPNSKHNFSNLFTLIPAWLSNRSQKRGKEANSSTRSPALWRNDSLLTPSQTPLKFLFPPASRNDLTKTLTPRIIFRERKAKKKTKDSVRH